MTLSTHIDCALAMTSPGRAVWVALSGGLDSSLLLTLAAAACRLHPRPLYALHVDHGLQPAAADFERHCRRLCSRLGVPLFVERACVDLASGLGLEGAAREARYAAFARRLRPGDTLWLAQHRDDQAETFLLAALRRSGVAGLAAMPALREFGGATLARPLLGVSRTVLEHEARQRALSWSDDPSNDETDVDRNYLRHTVMPRLKARWPEADAGLAAAAAHAGEALGLLEELAEEDLARCGADPGRIALAPLVTLSRPRQRLLLRHCATRLGLPTPPAKRLESLLSQLGARRDAEVRVSWAGAEARRWDAAVWLLAGHDGGEGTDGVGVPEGQWDGQAPLQTPWGERRVRLLGVGETALGLLSLRPRQGGERLRLAGRGGRDLKRLLQEAGVPPWRRATTVVVWHGDQPVAALELVEGRWVAVAEGWRGA